ncbi:rab GTPase-binding effector protein 2 isoform X5 [Physeter macrocephalus]|uniref:Rab GTPase-binding effector protein 2 n=1 Tax=Physeter macrocephalus TaxID=9755 RepID=A0A9W2WFK1_PHYMC|nr:rab GTPase-binding effector protein 2 isoform X5 [Physeter catodon]
MAAPAPAAAGEDGRRRQPEAALDPQTPKGAKVEAESGELDRLRAELAGALAEMETMKAVAEVSESTKAEAVAAVQRQCQEEVASLQAILKDSISSYEAQITSLKQERQQQQQDCEEKERELGRLKQLLSRAPPLDSLEKQMEKAHEDSEKLREIVLPMEQEIEELKAKLLRAEELIQEIQLVPDNQWEQLQMEGRQLQKDLESISRERDELQEGLRRSNEDCAKQMQVLLAQVQNSEQLLRTLQGTVSQAQERVQLQMAELATSHKCLSHEVKRLTEENQGLRAEQPPSSAPRGLEQDEGQEESLPSSLLELRQLVRRTQQEARAHQQAQEHEAERLRIEIVTLREALEEETVARASLEGQLRVQREETEVLEASLCSLRMEMERVQQEQSKARQQEVLRQPPGSGRTEELYVLCPQAQLTDLLSEQRAKMLRLQAELETSEQVQRDFVRLSQALQVRLERVRQAESLEQVRSIMGEAPPRDVRDIKDT